MKNILHSAHPEYMTNSDPKVSTNLSNLWNHLKAKQ